MRRLEQRGAVAFPSGSHRVGDPGTGDCSRGDAPRARCHQPKLLHLRADLVLVPAKKARGFGNLVRAPGGYRKSDR